MNSPDSAKHDDNEKKTMTTRSASMTTKSHAVLWLWVWLVSCVAGCSELSVTGGEGHAAISTRAMSLGLDLYTAIEVVPRSTIANTVFKHDCPACPSLGGTNPFGYVAFQVLGVGTTVDGLNERGLSASWQPFVDGTGESERLDSVTMHAILVPLTAYIMGNYVTADEVRSVFSSQKLTLTHDLAQFEPIPLTVVVHDARGESVVLTYANGSVTTAQLDASCVNHLASDASLSQQEMISSAMHSVNTRSGASLRNHQTAAQWTVLRDHRNLQLFFNSATNPSLRSINFAHIDFQDTTVCVGVPVTYGPWAMDMTAALALSKLRGSRITRFTVSASQKSDVSGTDVALFVLGIISGCVLSIAATWYATHRRVRVVYHW